MISRLIKSSRSREIVFKHPLQVQTIFLLLKEETTSIRKSHSTHIVAITLAIPFTTPPISLLFAKLVFPVYNLVQMEQTLLITTDYTDRRWIGCLGLLPISVPLIGISAPVSSDHQVNVIYYEMGIARFQWHSFTS